MRWQLRCVVEGVKGLVPFHDSMRRLKRHLIPYRPILGRGAFAIQEGLMQVRWLQEALGTLEGKVVLEIGSGWEPLLPLLFYACGASRVYLTDLTDLMDTATLAGTLESLHANRQPILDALGMDAARFDAMFSAPVVSRADFFERYRFVRLAPADCQDLPLEPASIDAITSRSVLEHIPPAVVERIFRESGRLLRPSGVLCHFIDNSDHWQHRDHSISRVNFLRYSDRVFRLTYINPLHYTNRLRHSEYLKMLRRCGFEIVRAEPTVEPRTLEEVATLPLAPRFRGFSAEDLAATDSYLLARKPEEKSSLR